MDRITRRELGTFTIGAWLATAMAASAASLPALAAAGAGRMEKRRLGTMECSLTGMGLVTLGRDGDFSRAARLIHAALDSGINFFDTGQVYGDTPTGEFLSEPALGQALAGRRDKAYIATKCGYAPEHMPRTFTGFSADRIEANCDYSLKQLRTDYIDLYQLHRSRDPDVPIEETLGAMSRLVEKGKVRFIGTSNGDAELLRAQDATARKLGGQRFISTQSGLSLLSRRAVEGLLPTLQELDIGLIPTSPLANGFLTGSYQPDEPPPIEAVEKRYGTEKNYEVLKALNSWARDHGHSILDLAFAWVAAHPQVVTIIAGASKEEHIRANARATQWKLTPEQVGEATQIASAFEQTAFRRRHDARTSPPSPASRNPN
jgi:aryl-alcohol dehydrogenase-like predicted oxidoreductase